MAKLCLNDWPNKSVTLSLITEDLSFLGSGISGSLTEVILLDESFLLFFSALLSSECLGTSVMNTNKQYVKLNYRYNGSVKNVLMSFTQQYLNLDGSLLCKFTQFICN